MSTIKVGLIGFGMAGRVFHAPLIDYVDGLELVMIRETKPDNVAIARERYPQTKIVDHSDAILSDETIDLVVIATPNKIHYELSKKALEAGKHVVVDKPFTVRSQEANALIALAQQHKKLISVYQNRRWDSDFLTVRKILASGQLGRLVEYEAYYALFRNDIRPNTWKEDGEVGTGLLYDLGAHLIDQALTLFGKPVTVTADLRIQRDNSHIVDHFNLMLDYGQLKVTLRSGMLVKEAVPKYTLLGTQGAFVKYDADVQEQELNEAKKSLSDPEWGKEPATIWGNLNTVAEGRQTVESERGDYPAYYQNIYKAISEEEELIVKPEQALQTIQVIECAMQSNQEKRTLPFV
jgi:scyllo-inositol 2-dehydrogenase (NADP+)